MDRFLPPEAPLRYREAVIHGTPRFPMRVYENDFSWYVNNIIDWHWHPELEFAAVLSGKVICTIGDEVIEAAEGEGFFINANTLHMERPADGNWPHMVTVCFRPEFIGDCGSDLIYEKYISPFLDGNAPRGMKLTGEILWQGKILSAVRELFSMSVSKEWGHELKCRNIVSEMWYGLAVNLRPEVLGGAETQPGSPQEKRLKDMIEFIHENYRSELSVQDIARSANISLSECFRCFRELIGSQPMTYLNDYRLRKAAELLLGTDMQITEVCFACGFNHISYFGKVFRKCYGVTPRQFRLNEKIQ